LKIYIITQEEPFFIPKMIRKLVFESKNNSFQIAGITILKPYRKNKSFTHWFKERAQIYNIHELAIVGFGFFISKLITAINPSRSNYSVISAVRRNSIRIINSDDINSEAFLSEVEKLKIDIILSISCPQIFKDELLSKPKIACINAHGTLLPRHRGVFGSWWMLFSGDKQGGSTIHTMDKEVDKGIILWQKEFEITSSHTQYGIAYQTKKDMATGLIEVIRMYSDGEIKTINAKYPSSYNFAPNRILGKKFHEMGKKILVLSDLRQMLRKNF
jgi:folate-dependent phosphoribosylglycinamide formyltransferase PurN